MVQVVTTLHVRADGRMGLAVAVHMSRYLSKLPVPAHVSVECAVVTWSLYTCVRMDYGVGCCSPHVTLLVQASSPSAPGNGYGRSCQCGVRRGQVVTTLHVRADGRRGLAVAVHMSRYLSKLPFPAHQAVVMDAHVSVECAVVTWSLYTCVRMDVGG